MKLTTNFIIPVKNLVPWMRLLFYGCAALGLGIALLFLIRAIQIQRQMTPLEQHLVRLQKQVAERKPSKHRLPPVERMARVSKQVAEINALSGGKGWPLARMMARLEQLMPASVYLLNLRHQQQSGEVQLVAVSRRADTLTAFLKKLEQEPHFTDVLLIRQTQKHKRGRALIQYELKFKERKIGT